MNLYYLDGQRRSGGYVAIRTKPTNEFVFAVVGSMTDTKLADALTSKYARAVDEAAMLKPGDRFWRNLTRGVRVRSAKDLADALAADTVLPWLVHDGMIHLTAPHGLEQYTGGAWGTRDVCQGSIELLLTLEHDQVGQRDFAHSLRSAIRGEPRLAATGSCSNRFRGAGQRVAR